MNESKSAPDPKNYHEGEEAAKRFIGGVRSVLSTSPAELKKRHERWEKERKRRMKS